MPWSCPFCTFDNDDALPCCEMCSGRQQVMTEQEQQQPTTNNPLLLPTPRVILHFDVNCFFYQVLALKLPDLDKSLPGVVRQKHIVCTANYAARAAGLKSMMLVEDAIKAIPNLIVLDGSDLTPFRDTAVQLYGVVRAVVGTQCPIQKKGMDEMYVEVTSLVQQLLMHAAATSTTPSTPIGHLLVPTPCHPFLQVGSHILYSIRCEIKRRLNLDTAGGVGMCRWGAKLAANTHKPNDQSILNLPYDSTGHSFYEWVKHMPCSQIPGVGRATLRSLEAAGFFVTPNHSCTIEEFCQDMVALGAALGNANDAIKVRNTCYGVDPPTLDDMPATSLQLGVQEAGLPHPQTQEALEARVDTIADKLFKLLAARVQQEREGGTCIRLSIRFSSTMSRLVQRQCTLDEPLITLSELHTQAHQLLRYILTQYRADLTNTAWRASHVHLVVSMFKAL